MRLGLLLDSETVLKNAAGRDPEIAGLTADSRAVAPGFLFAALPGSKTDGRAFVGEGSDTLERCFDDHAQMRSLGLQSFVNVPLLRGDVCYATFNVFAARPCWQPGEVLAIRLLALAAARWVPCAAGLSYCLKGRSISPSLES